MNDFATNKSDIAMSIHECAERMNISEPLLRKGLQQDKFPFGAGIRTTANRYTYWISRTRFEAYMRGD